MITDLEMVHTERTFESVDKLRLFSRSWERRGQARKAILIIQHGLKDHSGRYGELASALLPLGFAVYAMDLRGHGRSEGRKAYVGKFAHLVSDLRTFIGLVHEQNPGIPLFYFGHSMGGTLGVVTTINRVTDFKGIVLSAPALAPGEGISPALVRITRLLGAVLPWLPLMNLPNKDFSRDPQIVADMGKDPYIVQKNGPVRTAAQLLQTMGMINLQMEKFSAPVLILHGTADKLTNPVGSQNLAKRSVSLDKTLKLYPGLVHDLVHEPEKSIVIADIVGWLDSRVPRSI
jgi:acylglycerol lipase